MKINCEKDIMDLIGEPLRYIEIDKLIVNLFPSSFLCFGNLGESNKDGRVTIKFIFGNALDKGFFLSFHPLTNYNAESGFKLSIDKLGEIEDVVKNSIIQVSSLLKSVLVIERNRNDELLLNLDNGNSIWISAVSGDTDHTYPEVIIRSAKTKEIIEKNGYKILKEYYCKKG